MTHEEKLLAAINFLEQRGNTEQEACDMLGAWIYEATGTIFNINDRERKTTAIVNLRRLPHGQEILETERKRV